MPLHQIHAEHDHKHGEECGHVGFRHGDHTDYVHEGHIHRWTQGNWEECGATEHLTHTDVHDHVHGDGCGHPAIPHGDHTDYLHEGHRHVRHGDHWDDH
ncbi:hypothetical protein EDD30_1045 [Couchioplanes caeruleus]|uniref:Threonine dehydratase n=1 Tax=Couchioplanes caeruleus TaxID=56438 RepID=A0A3N1GDG8_9ACTN|nr:hypothetical protein EDD30_1045 [Couchioplanes caeruleus]